MIIQTEIFQIETAFLQLAKSYGIECAINNAPAFDYTMYHHDTKNYESIIVRNAYFKIDTKIGEYRACYVASYYNNSKINKAYLRVRSPRAGKDVACHDHTCVFNTSEDLNKFCNTIKNAIDNDVKVKLKAKERRESKRPIDELSIIANALDDAGITYTRHGNKIIFNSVFYMVLINENNKFYIRFKDGYDSQWSSEIIGDLSNPASELINNILLMTKKADELTNIILKMTNAK